MNASTVIGIAAAFGIVIAAAIFSTDNPELLLNPLGFAIVLGGTLSAALIAFPMREVLRVFKVFLIVLRNEKLYAEKDIAELERSTKVALGGGSVQEVEQMTAKIANPFLRTGLQLVLDGASADEIATILNYRIEKLKAREQGEANVFRGMASFAPALGMVGTLLGLVNMLTELGGDVSTVGINLAVALMTTLYGILAANLLFKPVAMKLEHRTQKRVELMTLVLEGVLLVRQRRSPTAVRETMKAFTDEHGDELGATRRAAPAGKSPAAE